MNWIRLNETWIWLKNEMLICVRFQVVAGAPAGAATCCVGMATASRALWRASVSSVLHRVDVGHLQRRCAMDFLAASLPHIDSDVSDGDGNGDDSRRLVTLSCSVPVRSRTAVQLERAKHKSGSPIKHPFYFIHLPYLTFTWLWLG